MRLDEIEWEDVELVPQEVRAQKQENVSGIISVSRRPFVFDAVKLAQTAQTTLEPEIKLLLDKHVFTYIKLPVNIRPRNEYDVRFISVDVVLESEDNQTVCWSMEPLLVEQEIRLKTESALSGGLKLHALELGISDNVAGEYVLYQPKVTAFGIGQSNPGWEFEPTAGSELRGVQILHMVVLIPNNTHATGIVTIKADIFKEGWLWNYRARNRNDGGEKMLKIDLPGITS